MSGGGDWRRKIGDTRTDIEHFLLKIIKKKKMSSKKYCCYSSSDQPCPQPREIPNLLDFF